MFLFRWVRLWLFVQVLSVPVFRDQICETLAERALFAPAVSSRQRAAAVAALGAIYLREGKTQTADEHTPVYLRKSQAERERAKRERGNMV